MKYIKELDSIRAIAALIVIFHHWLHGKFITDKFDGVAMFFVLSGFLISGILFENKNKAETLGTPKVQAFKNFFFRRAIRIFPIYYLVVFFVFFLGHQSQAHGFLYYLTYTSNFYIFHTQQWGEFTHLWSLAVEEQFYFIWPWIILFVNKRNILAIIITFILIGYISIYAIYTSLPGFTFLFRNGFSYMLTPACLLSLGLGSLLSWINYYKPNVLQNSYLFIYLIAILSFTVTIFNKNYTIAFFDRRILTSLITFGLIAYIYRNKEKRYSMFSFILRNKILIGLGKISYGIYLYHFILPYYSYNVLSYVNNALPEFLNKYQKPLLFVENFFILLLVSILSWKIIELPFLKLKKYFEYGQVNKQSNISTVEVVVR
ncbi:acyltransferase [Chitinophagaceae bacterium LB-8]|uniref:Acyltransferase n=1 Tax=Paraflavisolibacter caeni TaxID=2982496 RepID=A0A9X3BI27_9BACT|nr:acyltransferase [Paraflavisolibacter caeni]MCU7550627.1 acyltransferase [Paraflavisolibacter caeni]